MQQLQSDSEKKRNKEVADLKVKYEDEIKRLKLRLEGNTKGLAEELG